MTNDDQLTLSKRLMSLYIIYGALLAGQLMFGGMGFLVGVPSGDQEINTILLYIAPVLVGLSYVIGQFIYNKMSAAAVGTEGNILKLPKYQTACLIKWALQEAANLFAGVAFFISGDINFAYMMAVGALLFLLNRPSSDQLETFGA
jgi:hypothetical protein